MKNIITATLILFSYSIPALAEKQQERGVAIYVDMETCARRGGRSLSPTYCVLYPLPSTPKKPTSTTTTTSVNRKK